MENGKIVGQFIEKDLVLLNEFLNKSTFNFLV